jgi:hypothetical protein
MMPLRILQCLRLTRGGAKMAAAVAEVCGTGAGANQWFSIVFKVFSDSKLTMVSVEGSAAPLALRPNPAP